MIAGEVGLCDVQEVFSRLVFGGKTGNLRVSSPSLAQVKDRIHEPNNVALRVFEPYAYTVRSTTQWRF